MTTGFIPRETMQQLLSAYGRWTPGSTGFDYVRDPVTGQDVHLRFGEPTLVGGSDGALVRAAPEGFSVGRYDPNAGGQMQVYDMDGKDTGKSEFWKADDWNYDKAAMLATAAFIAPFALGAGGGMAGADPALWGDAGTMYAGTDAAAAGSLGGGASVAGGAGAAGGGTSLANGAGAAGGIVGPAAGDKAFEEALKNVATSSAPDWLKYLLTVAGAAAGAQGDKSTTTKQQDIPDWLKPAVVGTAGNPGLIGRTQELMNRQSAPGFLKGYDDMRALGQQMMATPQAGNGFNRFFPGR